MPCVLNVSTSAVGSVVKLLSSLLISRFSVVRLILQFLKENKLNRSLRCLQEESRVALSHVESMDTYAADIQRGNWDAVLQTASFMAYPEEVLHLLYEQVVCEILDMKEVEVARLLLKDACALQSMKVIHPDRYKRLENFCARGNAESRELYEGSTKEKRRARLADVLLKDVRQAPPSRLLTLLGWALKWHNRQGLLPPDSDFDLFCGTSAAPKDRDSECVTAVTKTIPYGMDSHVQCATFSPDGQFLITGAVDGLIEVLDSLTGTLRTDLEYQATEEMMVHEKAVMAVHVSKDSQILASGDAEGQLQFWKLLSGKSVRKVDKAHSAGITSLQFSKDSAHILTASLDGTAKIIRLRTGRAVGTFRGHESYVNSAIYTHEDSKVITGSSDGRVKIWNTRTFECVQSLAPPPPTPSVPGATGQLPAAAVNSVFLFKESDDAVSSAVGGEVFVVCTKSRVIHILNTSGQVLKTFSSGRREKGDFLNAVASPDRKWLYGACDDGGVYCFSNETQKLEHVVFEAHKDMIFGLAHHPLHSVLTSWAFDGNLNFYKPSRAVESALRAETESVSAAGG